MQTSLFRRLSAAQVATSLYYIVSKNCVKSVASYQRVPYRLNGGN